MGSGEPGWPFLAGMVAVLCAVCGLTAPFGLPAAGGIFFGPAGMLVGFGAAPFLPPRGDRGPTGGAVLALAAIGAALVGPRLPVLDFSTPRGSFFWGLCLGLWPMAASGPTGPRTSGRAGHRKGRP